MKSILGLVPVLERYLLSEKFPEQLSSGLRPSGILNTQLLCAAFLSVDATFSRSRPTTHPRPKYERGTTSEASIPSQSRHRLSPLP